MKVSEELSMYSPLIFLPLPADLFLLETLPNDLFLLFFFLFLPAAARLFFLGEGVSVWISSCLSTLDSDSESSDDSS